MDPELALRELLAILHRDGGHRIEEVGWVQATEEAKVIAARLVRGRLEENWDYAADENTSGE